MPTVRDTAFTAIATDLVGLAGVHRRAPPGRRRRPLRHPGLRPGRGWGPRPLPDLPDAVPDAEILYAAKALRRIVFRLALAGRPVSSPDFVIVGMLQALGVDFVGLATGAALLADRPGRGPP
jgi:hypothetical protein